MPDYDPNMEALVAEMLRILAPDVDGATLPYIDQLRALQRSLVDLLSGATVVATSRAQPVEGWSVTPNEEALLRFGLGRIDPKAGDQELDGAEVLRRLLSAIDKELFRWTSGLVQPPGPSGDSQVAVVEQEPV